jgi:hypothetical protein
MLVLSILLGCSDSNKTTDSGDEVGAWTIFSHPCVGNRTDALWMDDSKTAFVGCGSTTSGEGLYQTTDGGTTWSSVDAANNFFDSMRVNSISRGADGNLYIAGTGGNNARVVYLDVENNLEEFYSKPDSGAQSWQTFQVGTFRTDANGRAVSESLTGSDVMYWSGSDVDYVDGYGWWNETDVEGGGAQILDLEVVDNRFYAVGSTISQPPYFFYEADEGMGEEFTLNAVRLVEDGLSSFIGEVWDIAIDDQGDFLLAGVNQDIDVGVLWYNNNPNPYNTDDWTLMNVGDSISTDNNNATRFYGACRDGNTLVAVGDYSQKGDGLVAVSKDGGSTWVFPDTAAEGIGVLSSCQIVDGMIYIVGANGLFAKLDPNAL